MERLSVDFGKKSKLEFSIYPAPQVFIQPPPLFPIFNITVNFFENTTATFMRTPIIANLIAQRCSYFLMPRIINTFFQRKSVIFFADFQYIKKLKS